MNVFILTIFVVLTIIFASANKKCKPKYHFWRPYNGTIPQDAFLAGEDDDGGKSYVAKIIPLDQYLWTIPAQFKEGCDHIDFAWNGSKFLMRVDKFIERRACEGRWENSDHLVGIRPPAYHHMNLMECLETPVDTMMKRLPLGQMKIDILCTENPHKLVWQKVNQFIDEVMPNCCLVQAGIALMNNHIYNAYIGRGIDNGIVYIGRVYQERSWEGVHVMDGANSTKIYRDFEVLSYDCESA